MRFTTKPRLKKTGRNAVSRTARAVFGSKPGMRLQRQCCWNTAMSRVKTSISPAHTGCWNGLLTRTATSNGKRNAVKNLNEALEQLETFVHEERGRGIASEYSSSGLDQIQTTVSSAREELLKLVQRD